MYTLRVEYLLLHYYIITHYILIHYYKYDYIAMLNTIRYIGIPPNSIKYTVYNVPHTHTTHSILRWTIYFTVSFYTLFHTL